MTTPKPVFDVTVRLSDDVKINLTHLMQIFAVTHRQAQKALDQRQLYVAQNVFNAISFGLPKKLLDLILFQRYKITDFSVVFAVTKEKSVGPDASTCFRLVREEIEDGLVQQASIKVLQDDQTVVEFYIDGELAVTEVFV